LSALLQVSNLQVVGRHARAAAGDAPVHSATFELEPSHGFALIGESGCGRRTLAHAILRRVRPSSGEIHFSEQEIGALRGSALKDYRRKVQLVVADPLAALNPRFTVAEILAEPLKVHRLHAGREIAKIVETMMARIELEPAIRRLRPLDLTAEEALRISVARALSLEPQILILDQPELSLELSTTARFFELLAELQHAMGFALLFLTGNPGMARYLCRQSAVMYLGRIIEIGPTEDIIGAPRHPYTKGLLAAMPRITRPLMPPVAALKGDPPPEAKPPAGCPFHPRCELAMEECRSGAPPIRRADGEVAVWCHLYPESPTTRRRSTS